ncbi:hypothetical protein D3C80_1238070 [compost metagenome]
MDGLALGQGEGQLAQAHRHGPQGLQMHLDPPLSRVPHRPMREGVQVEVGPQLAVGPCQHVAVERRRHALGVVIGGAQNGLVLDQVHAEDEQGVRPQHMARGAKQRLRGRRRQVADGRSRKEADPPPLTRFRRQVAQMLEIPDHRQDLETRVGLAQPRRGLLEGRGTDVDRHIGRQVRRGVQHDARLLAGA